MLLMVIEDQKEDMLLLITGKDVIPHNVFDILLALLFPIIPITMQNSCLVVICSIGKQTREGPPYCS